MNDEQKAKVRAARMAGAVLGVSNAPPPPPQIRGDGYSGKRTSQARLTAVYHAIKPDPKHWSLEDDWEITDGALLLVDLEPREGLGLRIKELRKRDDVADILGTLLKQDELVLFRHVETVLRRAHATNSALVKQYVIGRGVHVAKPADFVAWVRERLPVGVELPEWMMALAKPSVDYEALIQSLRNDRDRLARELAEARAEMIERLRSPVKNATAFPVGVSSGTGVGFEAKPEPDMSAKQRATLETIQRAYDEIKAQGGVVTQKMVQTKARIRSRDTMTRYWPHVRK